MTVLQAFTSSGACSCQFKFESCPRCPKSTTVCSIQWHAVGGWLFFEAVLCIWTWWACLFLVVVYGCRCSVSVCLMGRLCERCRRHVCLSHLKQRRNFFWIIGMRGLLGVGCVRRCTRLFVLSRVCTACAVMFAILFRCCDSWLPRGRGAVMLHAGVALSQGTFRFAFSCGVDCVYAWNTICMLTRSSS